MKLKRFWRVVVVVRTDFTMRAQLHEFLFTFLELLHHKHTTLFAYAIHVYAGAKIYDLLPRALYRQGKTKMSRTKVHEANSSCSCCV